MVDRFRLAAFVVIISFSDLNSLRVRSQGTVTGSQLYHFTKRVTGCLCQNFPERVVIPNVYIYSRYGVLSVEAAVGFCVVARYAG